MKTTLPTTSMDETPMTDSRRALLKKALFGAGMWGLRSLATGIPVSVLMDPRKAAAQTCTPAQKAQYLIFATSGNGDPMNGNVPGTYINDPNVLHPAGPTMAPTSMMIGGKAYTAAAPWATLSATTLARTCFFHHGTYTVVHPDEKKVLELMGAAYGSEMFVSLLASQLSTQLCTIQKEPVSVAAAGASETIFYQGRPQPMLTPTSLATILTAPSGPLYSLQQYRDADLNRLNDFFKQQGNQAQKDFLDRYATSQTQVRNVGQTLMTQLASLTDNSPDSQITAAILLFQMNVTPVATVHIPFGGDNHSDALLATESAQHVAALTTINNMCAKIAATTGFEDKISFMAMNVFGRTMSYAHKQDTGRDHHGDHHCSILIGSGFKGSVVGGIEAASNDYRAQSLDSTTGAGVAAGGGDVAFADTMGSMAKTVGRALGVDQTFLDANISQGKTIQPALA